MRYFEYHRGQVMTGRGFEGSSTAHGARPRSADRARVRPRRLGAGGHRGDHVAAGRDGS
ncbi:hypothetical protein NKG94_01730 [Micromonospora sp. M12]